MRSSSPLFLTRKLRVTLAAASCLLVPFAHSGAQPALGQEAGNPGSVRSPGLVIQADPTDANTFLPPPPALSAQSKAAATAVFQPTYTGFSPAAQGAFQRALDIWGSLIDSPVPIKVAASFEPQGASDLGFANGYLQRDFPNAPVPNTWYPIALANARAGTDLDTTKPDIEAKFNSNRTNWHFGTGPAPAGQFDFVTVVLHELGHGLGFLGSMEVSGGLGRWGLGTPSFPTIYDRFTTDGSRRFLLNTSVYPNPSAALATALTSNNVFFDSALTNPPDGTGRPKLHAPPTWIQFASYIHLDEATYPPGNPNSLMTPTLSQAEAIHSPGPLTLCIFEALGWSTAQACPPGAAASATIVSSTTLEPGDSFTVSATGVASANSGYTLRIGTTAANCPTGLALGGVRNSDASFNIAPVQRIIPTNSTSGARWLCWVRTGDPANHSTPVQITLV
ncbi:MAG: hypothetical protein ABR540_02870 [Acidimicrobiales bacterium]